MNKVNLDALIPREDFEVLEQSKLNLGGTITTIDVNSLKKGSLFYTYLRKPDFQRETNEWTPKKVVGLIQSFLSGDLIPSLILWNSAANYIFVIDGAHRLGALIAWINDDYGEGIISKAFFEDIPEGQVKIAEQTRTLVNETIGPYSHYNLAATNPKDVRKDIVERAPLLAIRAFQLQWVNGDAKTAEQSFLKINQEASPINPVERKLIESRRKPNCIAARAIRRSGTGHQYWSHFSESVQEQIKEIAKEINDMIFIPPYKKPVKSIELPIAGKADSGQSLPLILNFVNIANGVMESEEDVPEDRDGSLTLEYLQKCKNIAKRINSIDSSSFGLHPAIYLYSKEGNYKPVSFYALLDLILMFEKDKTLLDEFIRVRKTFEEAILEYDYLIPQIVRKYRSGIRSYPYIALFYFGLIKKLSEGKTKEEAIDGLIKSEPFGYLATQSQDLDEETSKEFSISAKSAVVIKEAIENALRCKICNALIPASSITIDHKQRKRDGGLGTPDNAQIAHPYCNTTFKG